MQAAVSAWTLSVVLLVHCAPAGAQQAKTIPRIGGLRVGNPADAFIEAFRAGLQRLDYVEGEKTSMSNTVG